MAVVTLGQDDNGKLVDVKSGDTLEIRLNDNASTGIRWTVDEVVGPAVSVEREDYQTPSGRGVGGAGVRTFVLRAQQPGAATISLKLWREGTGPASIRQRFSLNVRVS